MFKVLTDDWFRERMLETKTFATEAEAQEYVAFQLSRWEGARSYEIVEDLSSDVKEEK